MRRLYLDYNATTPLDPRVFEAMRPWLERGYGNPSSLHAEGRAARRALEDAREKVAELIGAEPGEIVFTSGATEANNQALRNDRLTSAGATLRLAIGSTEHPSVLEPAHELARRGAQLRKIGVDRGGRIRLEDLDAAIAEGLDLVAIMAANNEVGTIQPWSEISRWTAAADLVLHVDAVQAPGKIPFSVTTLEGEVTAAFSAHKLGGPKGIGALYVRRDTRVAPLLLGGGQEARRRGGTENVAAAVGFGEAARRARDELGLRHEALRDAERTFVTALQAAVPGVVIHGPDRDDCLPGTLSLRLPGIGAEALVIGLDLAGVSISVGSACSSGAAQPSHVLEAMGLSKVENLESCRVSLGWSHPREELMEAARRFEEVARRNLLQQ